MLRQEQLSERFAVSRTPVREALRRLAALGLVSFEPNRGVRVRTLSREELREAFLVRAELESLATELAAPRMTEADSTRSNGPKRRSVAPTQALRARSPDEAERWRLTSDWVRANHGFHDVIYRVADSPLVERLAKSARRSFSGHAVWAPGGSQTDAALRAERPRAPGDHRGAARRQPRWSTCAGARARASIRTNCSTHVLEQRPRTGMTNIGASG